MAVQGHVSRFQGSQVLGLTVGSEASGKLFAQPSARITYPLTFEPLNAEPLNQVTDTL
jgi:hypothetical protein